MVRMQYSDICGTDKVGILKEFAKKHTDKELAEALMIVNKKLEEEMEFNKRLFVLAIKSKQLPSNEDD